ncbi:MAG TPA: NAD-dependent protein deacetylase [Vicinamibacteria bacterium]|nr:NAD-dependent protein deacetylase [Vicinamibacteria bacterium]
MTEAGRLVEFVDRHPRLVVLTGAGCSAPSGIPDYRSADGAWKHSKPMTFAEFTGSAAARRRYWAGSLRGWPRVRDAQPNPAHRALAALEARGQVTRLVTQNVDGLHQRAGSRRVVDLHGRLDTVECLDCGSHVPRDDVQTLLLAWNPGLAALPGAAADGAHAESPRGVDGEGGEGAARPDGDTRVEAPPADLRVPECRDCGGVLKPHVVFFGENVPRPRVDEAMAALEESDALLVVGSSLMVFSGYRFVLAARERGRPVAMVNLGQTRADGGVSLKVQDDCAVVLPTLTRS